jgi:hypothetical protein
LGTLLDIAHAARRLGTTEGALYRTIVAGNFPLPVFRIQGTIRIPAVTVDGLLTQRAERCHPYGAPN